MEPFSEVCFVIVTGDVGSWVLSLAKKEFTAKNSSARGSLLSMRSEHALEERVPAGYSESCLGLGDRKAVCPEAEGSQPGCVDSGNKSQGQKKGPRRQCQGLVWDELAQPAAPLVTSLMGTLRRNNAKKEGVGVL